MDTELGHNLIVWTVRISVALYVVAVWRYLFGVRKTRSSDFVYRQSWAASWLMCVIHVICAYHFQHHWDQAVALEHTAMMTERVVGLHWSGGLYVNYVFLTVWGIDIWRLMFGSNQVSSVAMHVVAAFMMFNATAIFGPVWWWIPCLAFCVAIFVRWRSQPETSDC